MSSPIFWKPIFKSCEHVAKFGWLVLGDIRVNALAISVTAGQNSQCNLSHLWVSVYQNLRECTGPFIVYKFFSCFVYIVFFGRYSHLNVVVKLPDMGSFGPHVSGKGTQLFTSIFKPALLLNMRQLSFFRWPLREMIKNAKIAQVGSKLTK